MELINYDVKRLTVSSTATKSHKPILLVLHGIGSSEYCNITYLLSSVSEDVARTYDFLRRHRYWICARTKTFGHSLAIRSVKFEAVVGHLRLASSKERISQAELLDVFRDWISFHGIVIVSCNDVLCKAKGMYDVLCVTCFDVISLRSGTVLDKQIQEHQLLVALKM
ncbi:Uncharacterized protein BM_BM606 [Brugia malayi]|uniref:Bm606 n=1 Tax=Brugia malayi TaxID=6279 RepID=A0A0K0JLI6_BRUMA|nr:Uncharacterized protein BM_BM606 [Brugia malayi]CRZ25302.1 Bm606 [Brugia malayi]VIO91337.1 Uncharacterized protein BM_BM606 [Brugia malayi]